MREEKFGWEREFRGEEKVPERGGRETHACRL